eukprot:39205-Eustigmatos_ZCMA.PRE.1
MHCVCIPLTPALSLQKGEYRKGQEACRGEEKAASHRSVSAGQHAADCMFTCCAEPVVVECVYLSSVYFCKAPALPSRVCVKSCCTSTPQ